MSEHFMTICKFCKKIINQCRCAAPNKKKMYETCDDCKGKARSYLDNLKQMTPIETLKFIRKNFFDTHYALQYVIITTENPDYTVGNLVDDIIKKND